MSIAAGTLSNHGIRIAPRIVLAVNTSQQGWIVLPALGQSAQAFNQRQQIVLLINWQSKTNHSGNGPALEIPAQIFPHGI